MLLADDVIPHGWCQVIASTCHCKYMSLPSTCHCQVHVTASKSNCKYMSLQVHVTCSYSCQFFSTCNNWTERVLNWVIMKGRNSKHRISRTLRLGCTQCIREWLCSDHPSVRCRSTQTWRGVITDIIWNKWGRQWILTVQMTNTECFLKVEKLSNLCLTFTVRTISLAQPRRRPCYELFL
jgi:hypothetical protein